MPAEWQKHEATWLSWPHNTSDWRGKFSVIKWVYGEIVRIIAGGETVRILVHSQAHKKKAFRVLENTNIENVEFFYYPTNRGWTRDFGPMFVRDEEKVAIVNFGFNAWARYKNWQKDNAIPGKVAKELQYKIFPVQLNNRDFVLEGGSIEVNGQGTLITTEECLLDQSVQSRNPGLSRNEIETVLQKYLGVRNILWLGRGIAGDDTHGHVDDICRFVNDTTVVLCSEERQHDVNYNSLQENRERLAAMRLESGSKIDIIDLPMPSPLYFDNCRLPASYANFYISNTTVLVPTFNDPQDRIALGILAEVFPDRVVVGIHAVDLVWGLGTIHCLTQQQPAVLMKEG